LCAFDVGHREADERIGPTQRIAEAQDNQQGADRPDPATRETEADQVTHRGHEQDDEDIAHKIRTRASDQHRRSRHWERSEAVNHAARQVSSEPNRGLCRPERDGMNQDTWHEEVHVAAARNLDGAAEDIPEQQHEHHRLDSREHQQLRLADPVAEIAASYG
jgi:hypothetical protein